MRDIYYLQYNGNEEELKKLYGYIHQGVEAGTELHGEYSSFDMSLETLISEESVDSHIKLMKSLTQYVSFTKLDGKFVCPINEEDIYGTNSDDIAMILHNILYRGCIRSGFYYRRGE